MTAGGLRLAAARFATARSRMHDVLISHLEEDSALALEVALVLEREGFSTREHQLDDGHSGDQHGGARDPVAQCRAVLPILSARSIDLGDGSAAISAAEPMRSEIASARDAGKPIISLLHGADYDVGAEQGEERSRETDGTASLRLPDAGVDTIRDELVGKLVARGAVAGAPSAERIAELERQLGRRESSTPSCSWPRLLFLTAYLAAIGLFFLTLDLFGTSSLSSKYSQDLLNQIFGAWYPAAARDESTVVLLTDAGLATQNEPWPASYRLHARILNAILAYGPRAVMIDMWFHDARDDPSLGQLERALARYRARGIPVYAAANTDWPGGGIREEIGRLLTPVPVPKIGDEQDRANRQYPLIVADDAGVGFETAALRIYREVVREVAWDVVRPAIVPASIGTQPQALSLDEWRVAFGDPMEVMWGTTSAPINEKSIYCSFERDPLSVAQARFFGGDGAKSDCPYAPTLLADDLLTRSSDEDVVGLIADKIVFYGGYIQGASDLLYPPTHLPIAGVYLHPMALDNLMTFGDDYVRRADPGGTRYATAKIADGVVLLVIAAMVVVFRNRGAIAARYPASARYLEHRAMGGLMVGLPLALAAVVGYVAFSFYSLAPLNWIGHLSIGGTLAAHPYERHLALLQRIGVGGLLPR